MCRYVDFALDHHSLAIARTVRLRCPYDDAITRTVRCFYINLDSAKERRQRLERNFDETRSGAWTLSRFASVDAAAVVQSATPGKLRDSEKACFLSHVKVLGENSRAGEPFMITEDDALFGRGTFDAIDAFVKRCSKDNVQWDVLFTDVSVPRLETMIALIKLRQRLRKRGKTTLLNLKDFMYVGATSYLVNSASAESTCTLLDANKTLDVPYDLYLRQLIFEGHIRGFVIFPFVTSVSPDAESSQIQLSSARSTDLIWNTFRRLMWNEWRAEQTQEDLGKIERELTDVESRAFGTVFSAMVSKNLL